MIDDAAVCTDRYEGEAGEMDTASKPAMNNLGTEPGGSNGIHSANPTINPVFAGYNRVRIEKCGFDRYTGHAELPALNGTLSGVAVTYDAYQLGWGMMVATLKELLSGLTYTTWSWNGGAPTDLAKHPVLKFRRRPACYRHKGGDKVTFGTVDSFVFCRKGIG